MAWIPRSGTFHYGRTESDYQHLIQLHAKYKLTKPPLGELKEAALADGYSPEKVAKFKYVDMSNVNVHKLLNPKKYAHEELVEERTDEDESSAGQEDGFDIDEFDSDNEIEDVPYVSDNED